MTIVHSDTHTHIILGFFVFFSSLDLAFCVLCFVSLNMLYFLFFYVGVLFLHY